MYSCHANRRELYTHVFVYTTYYTALASGNFIAMPSPCLFTLLWSVNIPTLTGAIGPEWLCKLYINEGKFCQCASNITSESTTNNWVCRFRWQVSDEVDRAEKQQLIWPYWVKTNHSLQLVGRKTEVWFSLRWIHFSCKNLDYPSLSQWRILYANHECLYADVKIAQMLTPYIWI